MRKLVLLSFVAMSLLVTDCVEGAAFNSPLLEALARKQFDLAVSLLQDSDAEVTCATASGVTPLHVAAKFGNVDIVQSLIRLGADFDAKDIRGKTPLYCAVQEKYHAVATLLVEAGADPNVPVSERLGGGTCLHLAVSQGDMKMVCLLKGAGANEGLVNNQGESSLNIATTKRNPGVCFVLTSGAKENVLDEETIQSMLSFVDASSRTEIDKLLDANSSPICTAVRLNNFKAVQILLLAGANVNFQDSSGWTPLHYAAHGGNYELCMFLLFSGANYSIVDTKGNTAFKVAHFDEQALVSPSWWLWGKVSAYLMRLAKKKRLAQTFLGILNEEELLGEFVVLLVQRGEQKLLVKFDRNVQKIKTFAKYRSQLIAPGKRAYDIASGNDNMKIMQLLDWFCQA